MSETQCRPVPLLFRFDALGLLAVPLGRQVLLPDVSLALMLRVLQFSIVVFALVIGIFADDVPVAYRILSHVVDGLVLLQLPACLVQCVARRCLGDRSEVYRRATIAPLDPCAEFCGEVARLLLADAALQGTMSDKDISPRDLLRRLEDVFSDAVMSGTLRSSDLERMGAVLFRHIDQEGRDNIGRSDLVGSSCCALPVREPKWTGSLGRAANFVARDVGVTSRTFRQLLDEEDAREQLNAELACRNTVVNLDLGTTSEPTDKDKEARAKASVRGLEEKVTDFLSQFLQRIERLELNARELSDTIVRQVASLERRLSDAKKRIDELAVSLEGTAAVQGNGVRQDCDDATPLAHQQEPASFAHHQDLARRIDTLVCRIASLELNKAVVPGCKAECTDEHVSKGAQGTVLKTTVVPDLRSESLPGRTTIDADVWQKSRMRLPNLGVFGSASPRTASVSPRFVRGDQGTVTFNEGARHTSDAAI